MPNFFGNIANAIHERYASSKTHRIAARANAYTQVLSSGLTLVAPSILVPTKLAQAIIAIIAGLHSETFSIEKGANYALGLVALAQFIDASYLVLDKMTCTDSSNNAWCLIYLYLPLIYSSLLTVIGFFSEVSKADNPAVAQGVEAGVVPAEQIHQQQVQIEDHDEPNNQGAPAL